MNVRRIFYRPDYQSEATKFLTKLRADNPQLQQQQIQGRALLWDKTDINPEQKRQAQAAKVAQKPYVYQTEPKTPIATEEV